MKYLCFFVLYILALEPDLLRTKTSFEKNICVVRSVTKGYQSYVKLIFYVDAYCDKIIHAKMTLDKSFMS